ncbi:T9SS type A sorting domain-containing protein, partial [bacterium]|nr:T9SS type A sorting domain-containing protein [bacterium]
GISVNSCNPRFADIDNDQDPDLFIGEGVIPNPPYPGLHLFQNTGTPQTAIYSLITTDLIPGNYHAAIRPTLADINGDDDIDVFLCDNDGIFYYCENIGTPDAPRFSNPQPNWQGISAPGGKFSVFHDLDGDLDLDLIFAKGYYGDTFVVFYRNIGSPESPVISAPPDTLIRIQNPGIVFSGIDIIDIDSDGDGDFFIESAYNGGILFFRNTTGDTSAVQPRLSLDPLHGIEFSIGPNPANPITWISYNLPYPQKAGIAVYNLLGQKVATLASGLQMPGSHRIPWIADDVASGVYWVRMEVDLRVEAKRVVVTK